MSYWKQVWTRWKWTTILLAVGTTIYGILNPEVDLSVWFGWLAVVYGVIFWQEKKDFDKMQKGGKQ